jgi:hypothetical protein
LSTFWKPKCTLTNVTLTALEALVWENEI